MPQQVAKLLLLWRREEEVIEWGFGSVAHTVLGKDDAISDVERGYGAFVPFYLSIVPIFMIDTNDSF